MTVLNSGAAFLERTRWGRTGGKHRSMAAEVELGFSPVTQKDRAAGIMIYTRTRDLSKLSNFDRINIHASNIWLL